MICPECESEDLEQEEMSDGQGYEWWETFVCWNCGCEFEIRSKKTVTKPGKGVKDGAHDASKRTTKI